MPTKVCFMGGARYTDPLDATSEKKFRALKSLGDIFVIGFSRDIQFKNFAEHARFYLLPPLPWPILRYVELFVFGQVLLIWLILRNRIDVVVAQSPYEGFVAALAIKMAACFGYRSRLVVEIHGDFEKSLFLQRIVQLPRLYRFAMTRFARYSIKRADLLRVISNSTREQVKTWAPQKTIVQFPTWTDIEVFLQNGETPKVKKPRILCVGVLTPLKGIHHLVNAFAAVADEFPRAHLSIIGKSENKAYAAGLSEQVNKLGLDARVQFMGSMPQWDLAIRMAESSVLVLPSLSEGLGRVLIEALAARTPVIGSRVGGIPEIIEDCVTGFLIPPADENALAEKLRWILRNPDRCSEMGKSGRAFVQRFFSTERYVKGYKQIFDMVQPSIEDTEQATSRC